MLRWYQLKDPRAVEAVDLRQDVPLHGGSENGDVERAAVLQSLVGKLVVHRNSVGSGGGFVLACGVGLCLHDAERKGLRLGEDRGCNDDDRERNGDSEFHEGASISDYCANTISDYRLTKEYAEAYDCTQRTVMHTQPKV